jgi:hypothetical protein
MPMLKAIEFNRQFFERAVKIKAVIFQRVLTAEFETGKTSRFQCEPQLFFILRLFTPQPPRHGCRTHKYAPPLPSPLLRDAEEREKTRRLVRATISFKMDLSP